MDVFEGQLPVPSNTFSNLHTPSVFFFFTHMWRKMLILLFAGFPIFTIIILFPGFPVKCWPTYCVYTLSN